MKIEQLIGQLQATRDRHACNPTATEAQLRKTETDLGFRLPPSYTALVTQFSNGGVLFGAQRLLGVGEGDHVMDPIQALYPMVEDADQDRIPIHEGGESHSSGMVPFTMDDLGNTWCFLMKEGDSLEEPPVAYLDPQIPKLYAKLGSFGEWLQLLIQEQRAVIRAVYPTEFLEEELTISS